MESEYLYIWKFFLRSFWSVILIVVYNFLQNMVIIIFFFFYVAIILTNKKGCVISIGIALFSGFDTFSALHLSIHKKMSKSNVVEGTCGNVMFHTNVCSLICLLLSNTEKIQIFPLKHYHCVAHVMFLSCTNITFLICKYSRKVNCAKFLV